MHAFAQLIAQSLEGRSSVGAPTLVNQHPRRLVDGDEELVSIEDFERFFVGNDAGNLDLQSRRGGGDRLRGQPLDAFAERFGCRGAFEDGQGSDQCLARGEVVLRESNDFGLVESWDAQGGSSCLSPGPIGNDEGDGSAIAGEEVGIESGRALPGKENEHSSTFARQVGQIERLIPGAVELNRRISQQGVQGSARRRMTACFPCVQHEVDASGDSERCFQGILRSFQSARS